MQPNLRLHATSRATELARVGEIGTSMQTLQWIREGVWIPLKNNRPPLRLNHGVSLLDATPAQLGFVDRELALKSGPGKEN
jgi:hypothetical protein